jgi:hypothetical protein
MFWVLKSVLYFELFSNFFFFLNNKLTLPQLNLSTCFLKNIPTLKSINLLLKKKKSPTLNHLSQFIITLWLKEFVYI